MLRYLLRAWQRHPPARFLRLLAYNLYLSVQRATSGRQPAFLDAFDAAHGTDTAGVRNLGSLDVRGAVAKHANGYYATSVDLFQRVMQGLPLNLASYSFVDFGSGKGRIVLLALRYPFKCIRGVEFSPELHEIARRNLGIYKDTQRKCTDVELVLGDATDFKIPAGPLVAYFYNPFNEHVMVNVLARIEKSLTESQAPAFVAYVTPVHRDILDRSEKWMLEQEDPQFVIYRFKCAADGV
jgi:SAM-dependent methyltransferase